MTLPKRVMSVLIAGAAPLGVAAQAAPVAPGDVIRMVLYPAEGGGVMSTQVTAVVETMRNRNDCLGVRIQATTTGAAELANVVAGSRSGVMTSFSIAVPEEFSIEVREQGGIGWTRVESGELRSAGVECIEGER